MGSTSLRDVCGTLSLKYPEFSLQAGHVESCLSYRLHTCMSICMYIVHAFTSVHCMCNVYFNSSFKGHIFSTHELAQSTLQYSQCTLYMYSTWVIAQEPRNELNTCSSMPVSRLLVDGISN